MSSALRVPQSGRRRVNRMSADAVRPSADAAGTAEPPRGRWCNESVSAIPPRAGIEAVIGLLLLTAVGCGGSAHLPTQGGSGLKETLVRSGTCSAAETKRIVHGVVHAFSTGDIRMLNRLVAPASKFQWFSAPGPQARLGPAAYRRSTLPGYVRRRHRHHEQLEILRLDTSDQADGNFGLVIVRQARDYPRRVVDAKGKVDCTSTPYLVVWSVGSYPATPGIPRGCRVI